MSRLNDIELLSRNNKNKILLDDIASVISNRTGVPVYEIISNSGNINDMENRLKDIIVGEDKAIDNLMDITKRIRCGYNDRCYSLLFVGSSGVGKSRLAKEYANILVGADNLIRMDMSEYSDSTAVNKILGSSPGYVGYDDNKNILEEIRNKPNSVLLLDEIDKRLSVIEAISKLSDDPDVDELTTLHPLITEARWVFGPEFDSPEYASNRQLQTIAKNIFHIEDANFINPQKRPDLVVKGEKVYSITGTESYDNDEISTIDKILIIELKRGGFTIGRTERNQAQGYVEDLLHSGGLPANVKVFAFVVGNRIDNISGTIKVDDNGYVKAITFAHIVDTANRRLFRLRDTLNERYAKISGVDLVEKVEQMKLL